MNLLKPNFRLSFWAAALLLSLGAQLSFAGPILDQIKKRGKLICGVSSGVAGMSKPDADGVWQGIDVDYCRAFAAAVLGDAKKVQFVPLTTVQRFEAMKSGEVDILSRGTTWTADRDAHMGMRFVGANFYDGQGVMAHKRTKAAKLSDLKNATFCMQTGNTAAQVLDSAFRDLGIKKTYKTVAVENFQRSVQQFESGRCDAYTLDKTGLLVIKSSMLKNPDDVIILPETLSKEPLGPAVRLGDEDLFLIGRWVLFAMINAEELGITSRNIDTLKVSDSRSDAIRAFLGETGDAPKALELDKDWTYRIVKQVGNYGESFDRNMKPLGAPRGLNALWNKGGILYAPPIR